MESKKIRVGVLFGGKSAEHEVSVRSARNVVAALDKSKYEVVLIGIDREGRWHLGDEGRLMLQTSPSPRAESVIGTDDVMLLPGPRDVSIVSPGKPAPLAFLDVVFPILHGPNGEDGTVQGLLRLANVPFVGPDVLGSAVGMDKEVMKRLFRDAGIPIGKFEVVTSAQRSKVDVAAILKKLGSPVFVKPANLGSSVGISKAVDETSLSKSIDDAFQYDRKIVIEEYIKGREIEVAVLGNENPQASIPGEIIHGPQHEFYSYEAKYLDCEGQRIEIPAKLHPRVVERIRALAVRVFEVLCCEGLGRVDFFVTDDLDPDKQRILVNEINTLPGFTNISMYPALWKASGLEYPQLIDRLLELAIERHQVRLGLLDRPKI